MSHSFSVKMLLKKRKKTHCNLRLKSCNLIIIVIKYKLWNNKLLKVFRRVIDACSEICNYINFLRENYYLL